MRNRSLIRNSRFSCKDNNYYMKFSSTKLETTLDMNRLKYYVFVVEDVRSLFCWHLPSSIIDHDTSKISVSYVSFSDIFYNAFLLIKYLFKIDLSLWSSKNQTNWTTDILSKIIQIEIWPIFWHEKQVSLLVWDILFIFVKVVA